MNFAVACYINDDSDILRSWLDHYRALGAEEFWFVVQGAAEDNAPLAALVAENRDLHVLDRDEREYTSEGRIRGCQRLVRHLRGRWVMLVDSDEFVELPPSCPSMAELARSLREQGADCLAAPMLHRVARDGELLPLEPGQSVNDVYPFAVPDLNAQLGAPAAKTNKHPFFLNRDGVAYERTHLAPRGTTVTSSLQGVTHHYKWRRAARDRIRRRAYSAHAWASEAQQMLSYLAEHGWRVPTRGAFRASTRELLDRGWLK